MGIDEGQHPSETTNSLSPPTTTLPCCSRSPEKARRAASVRSVTLSACDDGFPGLATELTWGDALPEVYSSLLSTDAPDLGQREVLLREGWCRPGAPESYWGGRGKAGVQQGWRKTANQEEPPCHAVRCGSGCDCVLALRGQWHSPAWFPDVRQTRRRK